MFINFIPDTFINIQNITKNRNINLIAIIFNKCITLLNDAYTLAPAGNVSIHKKLPIKCNWKLMNSAIHLSNMIFQKLYSKNSNHIKRLSLCAWYLSYIERQCYHKYIHKVIIKFGVTETSLNNHGN